MCSKSRIKNQGAKKRCRGDGGSKENKMGHGDTVEGKEKNIRRKRREGEDVKSRNLGWLEIKCLIPRLGIM